MTQHYPHFIKYKIVPTGKVPDNSSFYQEIPEDEVIEQYHAFYTLVNSISLQHSRLFGDTYGGLFRSLTNTLKNASHPLFQKRLAQFKVNLDCVDEILGSALEEAAHLEAVFGTTDSTHSDKLVSVLSKDPKCIEHIDDINKGLSNIRKTLDDFREQWRLASKS